ncbi:hypothetical protein ABTX24_13265 [Nocardioides sp. NPDC127514]|jgi:hypothetical protein|uniref:hypothetical protein n=1 Tax=unclassified Nocardioides TaxID=2615069 RepID=UPI00135CB1D3
MAGIVLRVRLIGGDSLDVIYDDAETASEAETIDHLAAVLSSDTGVIRCKHGERLLLLYARGVSTVEVAPRGAVL